MSVVFGIYDKIVKAYLSVQVFANTATAIRSLNDTIRHAIETNKSSDLRKLNDYIYVGLGELKDVPNLSFPSADNCTVPVKGVYNYDSLFITPLTHPVSIDVAFLVADIDKEIQEELKDSIKENTKVIQNL